MTLRAASLALALGCALQQPTFRSRVELIRLDVSVVDQDGRPLRDLRPDEFAVTIDGAPRQVAFAQFYGADETLQATSSPAALDAPVSTAANTATSPGRVIVIVADLESFPPGSERSILEAASALVDRLGPDDAVGLLPIPGRGIEVSRDHKPVREALATLRGAASAPPLGYRMSVREAEAFRTKDTRVISEVFERECRPSDRTCPTELAEAAFPMLMEADRRLQSLATTLTALYARLRPIEAPKSVVLLSTGVQHRASADGFFRDLQREADTAGVSAFVVQVEVPEFDASRSGPSVSAVARARTRADFNAGLASVAGAADATTYFGVGRAVGAFDRIRNEIAYSYQLGIESAAADADGAKRRVNVSVSRKGAVVRARKALVIPREAPKTLNPVDLLAEPVHFVDAPFVVSTYMTRGEEPSTLKVIVLIELEEPQANGAPSYAFTITGAGTAPFRTADRMEPAATRAIVGAQVAPGRYRLKAAVVDAAGRPGSLEMPIVVGLRSVEGLQFSDLIVGTRTDKLVPASRVRTGDPLAAVLELYSADAAQLDGLTVRLEGRLTASTTRAPLAIAEVSTTSSDRRRIATAQIPPTTLTPGTWVISALVIRGERVVGQVSRSIRVDAAEQ